MILQYSFKEYMNSQQQQHTLSQKQKSQQNEVAVEGNDQKSMNKQSSVISEHIIVEKQIQGQQDGDQESNQDCFSTQSDISFQSDLLEEHKTVLENTISKNPFFFRKGFKVFSQESNPKTKTNPIFKWVRFQQYLESMLKKLQIDNPFIIGKFYYFLKKEPSFQKFLIHIYYTFPDLEAAKTLRLVFFIWQLYLPYYSKHLGLKDTRLISQKIAEKINQTELKRMTKGRLQNIEEKDSLVSFLKIVTLTVLLVIQKCFQNPYWKGDAFFIENQNASITSMRMDGQEELQGLERCRKLIKLENSACYSR